MRPAMSRVALVLAALAVGACATAPIAPPVQRTGTSVNASFGRTWNGVIDVFTAQNIPIKTIDRSSGIIVTELLAVGSGVGPVADCGTLAGGSTKLAPTNASYNILVRGDSTTSLVKVTPRFVRTGLARGFMSSDTVTEECSTTGVFEDGVEKRVKAIAEGGK